MPRLVFLLGEEAEGPATLFMDPEYRARQAAFRHRLVDSGGTIRTVTTPEELERRLFHALEQLPRPAPAPAVAGHDKLVFLCHSSGG
jgi:hypothetical protein